MGTVELSIVIPCLNEAATISHCVAKAVAFIQSHDIAGEVIVADNGSTDGSIELSLQAGARVVRVPDKGYGAALRGGIAAAGGTYIVMGDADGSYDFERLENFLEKLRDGFEIVNGNRFKGGIEPGAMPALHRYLGNPVLSLIGRIFFKINVGDFHCGLRAIRKDAFLRLRLATTGMEFASEMIVKGALAGLRIAEVPTKLHRDGRNRPSHLRTWRDGWRHLRFLLTFSPRWLFLYPGIFLLGAGALLQALLYRGGLQLGYIGLDIHSMLYAAAMTVIGVQMLWFAVFTKVYGVSAGFLPKDPRLEKVLASLTLERGVIIGIALIAISLWLFGDAIVHWAETGYGALDPRDVMRKTIPSVSMMLAGTEFILASFFLGILRIEHRD